MKFSKMLGKKIGVLGLGVTGKSFIDIIKNLKLELVLWDDNPEGRATLSEELRSKLLSPVGNSWDDIDMLFVSPGVALEYPRMHPVVENAKNRNIPFFSDMDLFFENSQGGVYIGITGTNGKSTTVSLLTHIIRSYKSSTFECGNIGVPILSLLKDSNDDAHFVIELSSFQLDLLKKNDLHISVLLNISNDHLDRYAAFDNYVASKKSIFNSTKATNQSVINIDDVNCKKIYKELVVGAKRNLVPISITEILPNGFSYIDGKIYNNSKFTSPEKIYEVGEFENLPGIHNRLNILAAIACAKIEGIEIENSVKLVRSFKSLSHRLEKVGDFENICFINDSKATNAHAAKFALESYDNIYWLAGGRSKQDDFSELDIGIKNVKKAYLFGESKEKLEEYAKSKNIEAALFKNIDEAFEAAINDARNEVSEQKKYLLLAPACASLDQFQNFMKRGERFASLVKKHNKSEAA